MFSSSIFDKYYVYQWNISISLTDSLMRSCPKIFKKSQSSELRDYQSSLIKKLPKTVKCRRVKYYNNTTNMETSSCWQFTTNSLF